MCVREQLSNTWLPSRWIVDPTAGVKEIFLSVPRFFSADCLFPEDVPRIFSADPRDFFKRSAVNIRRTIRRVLKQQNRSNSYIRYTHIPLSVTFKHSISPIPAITLLPQIISFNRITTYRYEFIGVYCDFMFMFKCVSMFNFCRVFFAWLFNFNEWFLEFGLDWMCNGLLIGLGLLHVMYIMCFSSFIWLTAKCLWKCLNENFDFFR